MQIITLSPARIKDRIWVKFDNDTVLPLKIDDVARLKLKKFIDLSPDLFGNIQSASARYLLLDYALRQLSISPKTKLSLSQKLHQYSSKIIYKYHYPLTLINQLIDPVLQQIIDQGLLNDQDFVAYYLRRYPHKSVAEIKYNLARLGVSANYLPNLDLDKIRALVLKKSRHLDLADANSKNRLIAALCRKGFTYSNVKSVIDEISKSR